MTTNDLELVDTGQAAKILGISRPTLERWRGRGVGPRWVRHGRWIRYRIGDLHTFVESCLQPPTSGEKGAA